MIWDDLADAFSVIGHNLNDIFYSIQYIFSNLGAIFTIIFTPLNFAFNFFKGFFNGIATPPPETAISWVFPDNILAVFNSIPYWTTFMYSVGAGLSILVLVWIMAHLLKL
jgi:hypothetical protein